MVNDRFVWIDWLRVTAIFLVIIVHSTEPFYLAGEGSSIMTLTDAVWVSFFDTFARACVPLFIIASSYLQFPIQYPVATFFKRRALRVLVPFAVWTVIYAFLWGEPIQNFKDLLLNFNYSAGHLWFVYMLVGIYLLIPILSPWAERVSKSELKLYLVICFITTLIPFVRFFAGGETPVIYGPSGIPNTAKFPLWGECSWNSYGVFYYFSGFIGYMLFGLYLRRFVTRMSRAATIIYGVIPWVLGFLICFIGFLWLVVTSANSIFPIEGPVALAAVWETPWINDTTGVALMAIGWVVMYHKIKTEGRFFKRIMLPLSAGSYGLYLCHMIILGPVSSWLRSEMGTANNGILGIWTTPVQIILTALITFILGSMASILIRRIPRLGKYIMG